VANSYSSDKSALGKSYSKWMGSLENEDQFDALFFNISPMEAERMDPQQRLFLEESWKAIEDAGYHSGNLVKEKCGVCVGVGQGDYSSYFDKDELDSHVLTGMSSSILAARISYYLDLQGPAMSIDTACSSSLVAIDRACKSIQMGESQMALAGGVYVMTTEQMHVMTSKAGMLSTEGACYTFDQRANGFVPGEAVGVLVLKSLGQAALDGDHIYGVIKGSEINQDGRTNGITAPSFESQTRLEKEVYKKSNINPESITYV
jgi:acyl transferase domain-containing protein